MRIGLIGDVHGKFDILNDLLTTLLEKYKIDIAFQVGDFGFFEKNLKNPKFPSFPVPLYFIDGNHEDFRFLWKSIKKGELRKFESQNLYYQTRGSTLETNGLRIGFMGGALNVDQYQKRKEGNYITNDDVNLALKEFSENPIDMMISHSCPAGIGIGMKGQPELAWGVVNYIIMAGYDPGPSHDVGETQLTSLWERMQQKPKIWVYGHFHQFQVTKIENTQFICLPRLDQNHQCVIWDSEKDEIVLHERNP